MISEIRARQPREEEMKCGTQSADIRVIHRRSHSPRVALLLGYRAYTSPLFGTFASMREKIVPSLDKNGYVRRSAGTSRHGATVRSLGTFHTCTSTG
jgi:hypothetical protein